MLLLLLLPVLTASKLQISVCSDAPDPACPAMGWLTAGMSMNAPFGDVLAGCMAADEPGIIIGPLLPGIMAPARQCMVGAKEIQAHKPEALHSAYTTASKAAA
jgi:hypothetical protein